jgi:hypothetical protein
MGKSSGSLKVWLEESTMTNLQRDFFTNDREKKCLPRGKNRSFQNDEQMNVQKTMNWPFLSFLFRQKLNEMRCSHPTVSDVR